MTAWPNVTDDVLKRILWQFTSQKTEYMLSEIRKPNFSSDHKEAKMFYEILDYVLTHITSHEIEITRDWDLNKDYVVQTSKEWIIQLLKNKIYTITGVFDIDLINSLSAEKQESRTVKNASITILPNEHFYTLNPDRIIVLFEKINRKALLVTSTHAVRKQLELTQGGSLAVCKIPGSDIFQTVGIIDSGTADQYPQFRFKDFMTWEFYMPDTEGNLCCKLRYRHGSFMMPVINLRDALRRYLNDGLSAILEKPCDNILENIVQLTDATEACKHGAIIIMAPSDRIQKEAERLTNNNRGVFLQKPIPLIDSKASKLCQDTIVRMASIDGAILADFEGKCYAFGVILDGQVITPGNPDRGSRLNSTKTYVESKVLDKTGNRVKNASSFVGIVRSEDGMADILWGQYDGIKTRIPAGTKT